MERKYKYECWMCGELYNPKDIPYDFYAENKRVDCEKCGGCVVSPSGKVKKRFEDNDDKM